MQTRCLSCMEEYETSHGLCPHCGYVPGTDDVHNPLHLEAGTTLHGRYLVGRVVGFGGFGVTYVGWDFTLQQKVAIKEYLPSEFATRMSGQTRVTMYGGKKEEQFIDGMEKFVDEARRLVKFQNTEGVVRVFDSFTENSTAYIIMEYLEGETLTAYLDREKKIGIDDAVTMLTPVVQALEQVHQEGIIHRDIAPDNIFLTKDGRVKLIDFGAARYATTSHSRSLTVIIKPGYSPEEQYRSRDDQGPHTDVYALSAVLYRMITGQTLPDSMERRAMLEKNGKDVLVPPSKYCKLIKNQETAILNGLNVRIADRTPTAGRLLEELTAEKSVKRIFGTIKMTDMMRWPLWAKIAVPTAAAAVLVLLGLLFSGVIGIRGNLLTDISLGENEARVPSLVNYSVDVAQDRLHGLGLDCQIVGTEYSDVIPAGMVIYQNVSAGQVVEKDSVIQVYVSTDQGGVYGDGTVISVVYMTEPEAVAALEALGLKVTVEQVYDDIVAEGMVVSQSIAPGEPVTEGAEIVLSVSQGVDPDKAEASDQVITLAKEEYELYVGDSVTLMPEGGSGAYEFSSSDSNVVSVNKKGELSAKGAGSAIITVSSEGAEDVRCSVTVKDYTMSISPNSVSLFSGATANLSVSGIPNGSDVSWSSDKTGVATVNQSGKVTAVGSGKATITASWQTGGKTYRATATVTVEAQGITLSTYKISSFYVGETRTITAKTSSGGSVKWRSSNTSVATVSSGGVVTAVGGGSATITASFGSYSESCTVTVTQPGVSVTKSSVSLLVGDSTGISASTTPSGTSVSWSSDNTGVATVSGGTITAVGSGSTTIRAKISYAGKSYESKCSVTVSKPGVSLSSGSLSLIPGESATLSASTTPSGSSVSWSSSNTSVASVSGGTVKAINSGSATITASISYGGRSYSASATVTVANPTITVYSDSDTIEYSEIDAQSCTLTADVTPDGGTVSWSSNTPDVATISGNGTTATVKAVSEGSTTITATYSVNGTSVTDRYVITVRKAASTLSCEIRDWNGKTEATAIGKYDLWISGTVASNYELLYADVYIDGYVGPFSGSGEFQFYVPSGTYTYEIGRDFVDSIQDQAYNLAGEVLLKVADLLWETIRYEARVVIYDSSGRQITSQTIVYYVLLSSYL